jgi:hypothetical protein
MFSGLRRPMEAESDTWILEYKDLFEYKALHKYSIHSNIYYPECSVEGGNMKKYLMFLIYLKKHNFSSYGWITNMMSRNRGSPYIV